MEKSQSEGKELEYRAKIIIQKDEPSWGGHREPRAHNEQ